jgi:hypothetical protein
VKTLAFNRQYLYLTIVLKPNPTPMRKIIFAVAILLPLLSFSQKVDLDRFKFTTQYRTLPTAGLDTSYHTYNITIESSKLMRNYLDELSPASSVVLDGWKKLDSRAHVTIQVKLEDLLAEAVSLKEREEILKDKAGKETGRRKYYWQELTYTFAASADINDYKGAHIENIVLADRNSKQLYRSPEFEAKQMAEGYFMINNFTVTGQLYKDCVTRAMSNLNNRINNEFGYAERTVTDQMWILGSKKHPEYQAHRDAFLLVSEVLFSLSANQSLAGVREKLEPAISYFESIKKKYPSTGKWDRKLRYASYYNLAVLYYYLDDPQSMIKEASGLVLNDFDTRDGKNSEALAMQLKNLFVQTKIHVILQ